VQVLVLFQAHSQDGAISLGFSLVGAGALKMQGMENARKYDCCRLQQRLPVKLHYDNDTDNTIL